MRYEKLELMGAFSEHVVIAAQFVTEGFSSEVFTAFAQSAVEEALKMTGANRQVIVFLDNSPRHFGENLFSFARNNQVVFLYNFPHDCTLNPIEFAWEFAKRPFRFIRDYSKPNN